MTQIIIFLISSTSAPKNSSKRRALFSECGGMRGCSGTDEDEAGKKKITVYSLQKTRLHHWLRSTMTQKDSMALLCAIFTKRGLTDWTDKKLPSSMFRVMKGGEMFLGPSLSKFVWLH